MTRSFTPVVVALVIALTGTAASGAEPNPGRLGLYCTVADSPEATAQLIARCKAAGFDTLIPSLSGGGTVIWKTDRAQYYPALAEKLEGGYDALAELVRQARAAGIRVIPSVAIGPGGRMLEARPDWETLDRAGRRSGESTTASFSFAYPEARAAKIELVMDLVRGYEVDGVLLDYCRYPENSKAPETRYGYYGYDAPLLEVCRAVYGFDPRLEPIDSPKWKIFQRLRAETVTAFVAEFRQAVSSAGRPVLVVGFGDTDPLAEMQSCGRDWGEWGRRGLIDEFYLATYTEKGPALTDAVARARAALGPTVRLHAALTPFNRFVSTPAEMAGAADALLAGAPDGLWVYREDYLTELDLWRAVPDVADRLIRRSPGTPPAPPSSPQN